METTSAVIPISDLQPNFTPILALAEQAPVFLTQNKQAAGVLISPAAWSRLTRKLEEMQDVIDVLEAELALARGEDEYGEMTAKDLAVLQTRAGSRPASV